MHARNAKYDCAIRAGFVLVSALGASACFVPPPKIAAIPPSGLAVRLYVFGASANDAHRTFAAVKENNPSFSLVSNGAGGRGDILIGLENDSPKCVPPTAMCSYRVSYRIRDNTGAVVSAKTTTVSATANKCADLCAQALTNATVQILEIASAQLADSPTTSDAQATSAPSTAASIVASAFVPQVSEPRPASAAPTSASRAKTSPDSKATARAEPLICAAAHGPRLPSEDAETRTAQVEVLKRLSVIDQEEYDCLRKAYLERL